MTSWLPDRAQLRRPIYRSLLNAVIEAIEDGRLAAGMRLPTHRALAHRLNISVQTVSRTYEELTRRSLIVGEVGRGTFVRPEKPVPAPPFIEERSERGLIDLSILKPVVDALHVERAKAALGALQADLPAKVLFSFRPSRLQGDYREIALSWLQRCGVATRANQVHITNGATPAMTIALMAAARGGGLVATEAVGHHTLRPLVNYLGGRLMGLECDQDGIVPEAFEEACATYEVKVLYVVPSCANPTVTMVSLTRREALVEIARRHGVSIVENDAWGPLVEDRPPPFASLAPERTLYITSFTKIVMPGLRTGYLVAPETMSSAIANRHLVTNWIATPLLSELASRWVADGTAWELVQWQRGALRARHRLVGETLTDIGYNGQCDSLHVWLPLPSSWREEEFVGHARLAGVAIAPGSSFVTDPSTQTSAVRISVGATSAEDLRHGLEVVARLARGEPEPALLAI